MEIKRRNDPTGVSVEVDLPVEKDGYAQRILTENRIPGLCRLWIKNTDGERRYCFPIGRMQSLPEAAEKGLVDRTTLKQVLEALLAMETELEDYLLGEDCLLLEPELIFLAEEGRVCFCACPGQTTNLWEALPKVIQWFWETAGEESGHRDPEQGLWEEESPDPRDLLTRDQYRSLLALCGEAEPDLSKMTALLQEEAPEEEPLPVPTRERQASLPGWVKRNKRKQALRERGEKSLRILGRLGSLLMLPVGLGMELLLWKSGILADFSRWLQAGLYGVVALFFLMMTLLLRESETRKLMKTEEALDLLPPPEEDLPPIRFEDTDTLEYDADQLEVAAGALERGETVLLSELMVAGSALGILISRQPERRPNLYITTSPFRIGKEGSGAHGEPESRYLSRDHALLEATEEGCRLRDEGSTNGTFVNGDRLLPGQWILLADGDEVRFADAPYRYRQGCG